MINNSNQINALKQEIKNAIADHGIKPPIDMVDDGKVHRYSTSEDLNNNDGWYIFHSDGVPVAIFGCHRNGISSKWVGSRGKAYSPIEKELLQKRIEQSRQEREIASNERVGGAKARAASIWSKAQESNGEHAYLATKQIKPYIARESHGSLLIPLYQAGELTSLQIIDAQGGKKFLQGGLVSDSYCVIGKIVDSEPICICEGYATGASIHEATSYPVVIAFNAGNLPKVAKSIRASYPNAEIIIAGDDDFQNPSNPGMKYAKIAAEVVKGKLAFPEFSEPRAKGQTDFNDMAKVEGLFVVAAIFDDALKKESLGPQKFSLQQFSLNGQSEEMRKKMLEDRYVLGRMAILGQFVVFYAAPNVGKTLLILWMIMRAVKEGQIKASDVFYINADDNHKGLTFKLALAEEHGFQMLAPGYNNLEPSKLLGYIKIMIQEDTAREKIIVLDTLKKFTDIMRKDVASEFGKTMRAFVSHGGTVISLAHVNKHKNSDGKSVYGGTSDIADDADCYYMIEEIQVTEKTKTVRFENRKSRGDVDRTATFVYSNQKVSNYQELLDSVKTVSEAEAEALAKIHKVNSQLDLNKEVIGAITTEITGGNSNRTELINAVSKATLVSKVRVKVILDLHTGTDYKNGHRWNYVVKDKNCHIYSLIDPNAEMTYRGKM